MVARHSVWWWISGMKCLRLRTCSSHTHDCAPCASEVRDLPLWLILWVLHQQSAGCVHKIKPHFLNQEWEIPAFKRRTNIRRQRIRDKDIKNVKIQMYTDTQICEAVPWGWMSLSDLFRNESTILSFVQSNMFLYYR